MLTLYTVSSLLSTDLPRNTVALYSIADQSESFDSVFLLLPPMIRFNFVDFNLSRSLVCRILAIIVLLSSLLGGSFNLLDAMAPAREAKDYPFEYLLASAMAAAINYPLWRASALAQSGFRVTSSIAPPSLAPYLYAFAPPYKGMVATVLGMTWARAAIFWGSDCGKELLLDRDFSVPVATLLPPLIVSTGVQCINMPVVRATITIQNPQSNIPNVWESLKYIYRHNGGASALWHGTSAGILKTVPKYCTAVAIKDWMEEALPRPSADSPTYKSDCLWRSAYKSAVAGVAGAALTNPLDVIRNEMFKTNKSLLSTIRSLHEELGVYNFVTRGMGKNLIAVAIPVGCTIFFTDALIQYSRQQSSLKEERRK